ncbi:hypothetical protein HKD37_16G045083 [Glycine soja]
MELNLNLNEVTLEEETPDNAVSSRAAPVRPDAAEVAAGGAEEGGGAVGVIGDHVPPRERFVIPRENIPNKRRKQLRDQFMRRTRLVLKESEHDPWCKKYMELYNELRENWERLYWDEGYSKKLAQDHANYESAEDDDGDFSPYRSRRPQSQMEHSKDQNFGRNRQSDNWEKVSLLRDKFEYDRERRMREKAFAPMRGGSVPDS